MRAVDYVTHGFGGWTDIITRQLQSQEFKDLSRQMALRSIDPGYFSSPSGPAGASVSPTGPTPRSPAEAVQMRLAKAGYPTFISNAAFSVANRFGTVGLDRTINFLTAYFEGLRAWGSSSAGQRIIMMAGPGTESSVVPKKVYIEAAKSAFNTAASRFGIDPLSKSVRDFTMTSLASAAGDRDAGDVVIYVPGGVLDILKRGSSIG